MRVSTSTSYSMVGALNKLPIAVSGMIFFTKERALVNVWSVLSIILGFSSGLVYSVAQIRMRRSTMTMKGDSMFPLKSAASNK